MTRLRKPEDNTPQDIQIEGSSGNVFADLGFENADEELLKAQLAHVMGDGETGRSNVTNNVR